jgi:hypothetical protein
VAAALRSTLSRRHLAVLGAALGLSLLLLAALPEPAHADIAGSVVNKVVEKLFGVKGDWITGTFVQWLIRIPDVGLTSDGGPHKVYVVSRDIAFASLGAVVTFSIVHYWAAGLTSQGGGSPILAYDGILRTCGVALFILAWPFLVDNGVTLAHIASDQLVPGKQLDEISAVIVGGTALSAKLGGGVPLLIGIIVMIAFAIIILIIFITKVMLGAGLMAAASGMPLALALWPIPALSWLASGLMRLCLGIVAVQLAWAVELGLYARIPHDFLLWSGAGPFVDKLIRPLTMLALLMLMLSTASAMLRMAGYGGGGFIASMAPYFGSQVIFSAISRGASPITRLASLAGMQRPGPAEGGTDGGGRGGPGGGDPGGGPDTPKPGGTTAAEIPAAVGAPPGGGEEGGTRAAPSGNGGPPNPSRPSLGPDGLPTRAGHPAAHQAALEMMERLRTEGSPRRGSDVADALGTIERSGLSARGVADYVGVNGGNDRQVMSRMADASIAPGVSPQAAAAFRTIGIAQPSARTSGINLWQSRQPSSTGSSGAGAPPPAGGQQPTGGGNGRAGGSRNGGRGRPADAGRSQGGSPPDSPAPDQPPRSAAPPQQPPTPAPKEGSSE